MSIFAKLIKFKILDTYYSIFKICPLFGPYQARLPLLSLPFVPSLYSLCRWSWLPQNSVTRSPSHSGINDNQPDPAQSHRKLSKIFLLNFAPTHSICTHILYSRKNAEELHSRTHCSNCRRFLGRLLLVIFLPTLFIAQFLLISFNRNFSLFIDLIRWYVDFRYGFMFGRESARKELSDLIESLRRANSDPASSSLPPQHSWSRYRRYTHWHLITQVNNFVIV